MCIYVCIIYEYFVSYLLVCLFDCEFLYTYIHTHIYIQFLYSSLYQLYMILNKCINKKYKISLYYLLMTIIIIKKKLNIQVVSLYKLTNIYPKKYTLQKFIYWHKLCNIIFFYSSLLCCIFVSYTNT